MSGIACTVCRTIVRVYHNLHSKQYEPCTLITVITTENDVPDLLQHFRKLRILMLSLLDLNIGKEMFDMSYFLPFVIFDFSFITISPILANNLIFVF